MITYLESRAIADAMTNELVARTSALEEMGRQQPELAIVEGLGDTCLSGEVNTYVNSKLKLAEKVGVGATHLTAPGDELRQVLLQVNNNPDTDAAIVEEPIPGLGTVQTNNLLDVLDPAKAVDNQGALAAWGMGATSEAIVRLLDGYGHTGEDEHVLIVGNGNVGGPLVDVYGDRSVTDLSVVNADNKDKLPVAARAAGLIVVATTAPNTMTPDMVQEGHVIVEVGAGNVHPDVRDITDRSFSITPKKGGVGLLTSRILLGRVVHLAEGGKPQYPSFSSPAYAAG